MKFDLINYDKMIEFFSEKKYNCLKPYHIINNNDTVFVSAGIQPILKDYRENKILKYDKIFVSQPVIRTQYLNSIEEGSSIAFVNVTSSSFNNSEEEHNNMVKDWYEFMEEIGISSKNIFTVSDTYVDRWGDVELTGKRTFHYYNNVEIGDTTFFTKVIQDNQFVNIDSMSDLGFGLERIRWLVSGNSYFDIYSDMKQLNCYIKAYISVLALLAVNNVKPSNKNSGYRARLFSKKLVNLLDGRDLNDIENLYLDECIRYWNNWYNGSITQNKSIILDEFIRNGNRYILDMLEKEGFDKLSKIDINITRDEFYKRLYSSGVPKDRIKKLIRK